MCQQSCDTILFTDKPLKRQMFRSLCRLLHWSPFYVWCIWRLLHMTFVVYYVCHLITFVAILCLSLIMYVAQLCLSHMTPYEVCRILGFLVLLLMTFVMLSNCIVYLVLLLLLLPGKLQLLLPPLPLLLLPLPGQPHLLAAGQQAHLNTHNHRCYPQPPALIS